jgi:uncharacterized membrane protein YbaN (DUF454 family)
MNFLKSILIILGTLSLCIGVVGIVVPGLPTTPFLLLTAGLYLKSSDRLYQKVITNRYIGRYITDYQKNRSISLSTKIQSIGMIWLMIFISCYFFINVWWIRAIVLLAGSVGTIVVGFVIKTK